MTSRNSDQEGQDGDTKPNDDDEEIVTIEELRSRAKKRSRGKKQALNRGDASGGATIGVDPRTQDFDWDDAIDEETGYSPFTIYTDLPAQEVVTIRIPSFLARDIAKLVEQRKIPKYETRSDFIKDAILHRVKFANDHLAHQPSEEVERHIVLATEQREVEQTRAHIEAQENYLKGLSENIDNLVRIGGWDRLIDTLAKARKTAGRKEEPWRSRSLEIIEAGEEEVRKGMR